MFRSSEIVGAVLRNGRRFAMGKNECTSMSMRTYSADAPRYDLVDELVLNGLNVKINSDTVASERVQSVIHSRTQLTESFFFW